MKAVAQVGHRRSWAWSALTCSALLLASCGSESNSATTTSAPTRKSTTSTTKAPATSVPPTSATTTTARATSTTTTPPKTTAPPKTTTTKAPAPEEEVTPAVACQRRPPANEELIVRETDPATTTWAYDIGGGWTWDFSTEECVTSVEMILRATPPIDGYCVQVAPKSANAGYDLNADPAAPLNGVIGRAGDC